MAMNWRKRVAAFLSMLLLLQMVPATFAGALADSIMVLSGMFMPDAVYYTVAYQDKDGNPLVDQLVIAGSASIEPDAPEYPTTDADDFTYVFTGWKSTVGNMATNNITDNVVFKPEYRKVESVAFIVNYKVIPAGAIEMPPSAIAYYELGSVQDIYIKSPAVVGFKPDREAVDMPNTTIAAGMTAIEITYTKEPEKSFTVNYYLEKPGIPMDDEVTPGNMAQFTQSSIVKTGLAPFGAVPAIEDIEPEGFTQLHKVYAPIDGGDNIYEVFYKRDAYYLSFSEGDTGDGNFYVEPLYLKYDSQIDWNAAEIQPTQSGYTFTGWDLSTQYTNMPANNLVAKATWTPSNTVPYTVVHWVEKAGMTGTPNMSNPNDFFLYKSEDKTNATAGSKLNAADQVIPVTVQNGTATVPYAEYLGGDSNVAIKGDGSTVINVYYQRIAFEVVFESGTAAAVWPGDVTELRYSVKYEGYIGDIWPADDKAPVRTLGSAKLIGWDDTSSLRWVTKRTLFNAELLPKSGTTQTFKAIWATSYDHMIEYYFEAYPGQEGGKVTFDQVAGIVPSEVGRPMQGEHAAFYIKDGAGPYSQIAALGKQQDVLNPKDIEGMDYHATKVLDPGNPDDPVTMRTVRIFFNRKDFTLNFNLLNTNSSIPSLGAITGIKYDEPIAKFEPKQDWVAGVKPKFTGDDQIRYTFGGWYADTECVTDFNFDQSMPFNDCVAYAKWVPDTVNVTFISAEGAYNRTFTIAMGASMGKDYPSGLQQVENVNGYQFDGWFLNGKPFPNTMPVYTDITVKAQYTPENRSYTVKYQDTSGKELAPTRTISGYKYGDVITYPDMEKPLEIAGYSLVDGQSGSITLGANGNEIVFKYVAFAGYKYQVEYRYEKDGALVTEANFQPNPAPVEPTSASQLLLWAKRDTTGKYYAVQDFVVAQMSANETKTIVFEYAPYQKVKVREQGILVGANDGYIVYDKTQADARIGQTVYTVDNQTIKTYGGNQYKYVEGYNGTPTSVVADGKQDILLKRYYVQVCDYTFNVTGNGKLNFGGTLVTTKTFERLYGDASGDIVVPTPVPNDNNTYFAGWKPSEPSIPATITQGMTYTAEFKAKGTMTLKAASKTELYDGKEKSVAAEFTVLVNGVPTTEYTVSGITVSGVSATNHGTYTNTISGTAVIMKGSENVTDQFNVELAHGSLVINKRTITFTPKAVSLPYNGQHQTAPTSYTVSGNGLAENQVAAGVVVKGGGTANGPYTLSIDLEGISIHIGTTTGTDVSDNYIISVGSNASMTITVPATKIPFTIAAKAKEVPFSGNQITFTTWAEDADWSIPNKSTIFPSTNGVFRITQTGSATFNPIAPVEPRDYTITPPTAFKVEWAENTSGPWANVTDNYDMAPQTATLKVKPLSDPNKIPLTVTAGSTTKTYNAQTQTHSGDAAQRTSADPLNGWMQGTIGNAVSATAPFSGSGMEPTVYSVKFTNAVGSEAKITTSNGRAVDVTSNYSITPVEGSLEITTGGGIDIVININSKTMAYTGKPFVHDGLNVFTVSDAFPKDGPDGTIKVTYTIAYDPHLVKHGSYPGAITLQNFKILRVKGGVETDITGYYNPTYTGGNLTITELGGNNRLFLEIKPNDGSAYYDGSTQTVNRTTGEASVKVDGVTNPSDYRVVFNAQGSGKFPGAYQINVNNNWEDYKVYYIGGGKNEDVTVNYRISQKTPGIFTIKNRDDGPGGEKFELVVTPSTVTKDFTGLPQTVGPDGLKGTFTITGITDPVAEGYTVTFTASGSGTYPGTYPIAVTNSTIKVFQNGVDVTSSFDCNGLNGDFVIAVNQSNKPVIAITPKTITKPYDGGAPVTGETMEYNVTYLGGSTLPSDLTVQMKAKGQASAPGANYVVQIYELAIFHEGLDKADDWYDVQTNMGNLFLSSEGLTYTVDITPTDITRYFDGKEQSVTQDVGTILIDGTPYESHPNKENIEITFLASSTGLMPDDYPLVVDPASYEVKVNGVAVTELYTPTFHEGQFHIIAPITSGEVSYLRIMITPEDITEKYTGKLIERSTTTGTVMIEIRTSTGDTDWINAEDSGFTVDWEASGRGVVPGLHLLLVDFDQCVVKEKKSKLEVTGKFALAQEDAFLNIVKRKPGDLISMVITPADDLIRKYTGELETFDPNQDTLGSTVMIDGVSIKDTTRGYEEVNFTAHGEGTADGEYDVVVQNKSAIKVYVVGDPDYPNPRDLTDQYDISYETGTLRINPLGAGEKIPLFIRPDDVNLAYTGHKLSTSATTITGSANGYLWHKAMNTPLPSGLQVQFTAYGEGIAPKDYNLDFTKNGSLQPDIKVIAPEKDVTHNYQLMNVPGIFKITPLTAPNQIKLSITPKKETYQYTGETIHADGTQNASGTGGQILHGGAALPATLKVEYKANGQGLLPGVYTNGIVLTDTPKTTWQVTTTDGDDVTDNYTLVPTPNDLVITDRNANDAFVITVKPKMVEKLYTGSTLTASTSEYEYAQIGGVAIDSNLKIVFTANGSGIADGDHPLTIDGQTFKVYHGSITPANEVTKNYRLEAVQGIFRITSRDSTNLIPLYIKPNDVTKMYNGTLQTAIVKNPNGTVNHGTSTGTLPGVLAVTFTGRGEGMFPDTYDILVAKEEFTVTVPSENNKDTTKNYVLVPLAGDFHITDAVPKLPLDVYPGVYTYLFDGEPHQVTLTGSAGMTGVGNYVKLSGTDISQLSQSVVVTFSASSAARTQVGSEDIELTDTVNWGVTIDGVQMKNSYELNFVDGTMVIEELEDGKRIPLEITPTGKAVTFDGNEHTHTDNSSGIVKINGNTNLGGATVTYTATASGTEPGSYKMVVDPGSVVVKGADGSINTGNYALTVVDAFLNIEALPYGAGIQLFIQPTDISKPYNGHVQSVIQTDGTIGYGAVGVAVPTGLTITFEAVGEGQAPDIYLLNCVVSRLKVIVNKTGANVTNQFRLVNIPGEFIITSLADGIALGIRPGDRTEEYRSSGWTITVASSDANALVPNGYIKHGVDGETLPSGIEVTFTASATGTPVAKYNINVTTWDITAVNAQGQRVSVKDQYAETLTPGEFEITPLSDDDKVKIVITPSDREDLSYNGHEQSVTVTTGTITVDGMSLADYNAANNANLVIGFTAYGKGTAPHIEYPINVDIPNVTVKSGGSSVKENYTIAQVPGNLRIQPLGEGEKLPLTVTANDASAEYTGVTQTAQVTEGTITDDTDVPAGYALSLIANGSGRAPDTYPMTYQQNSTEIIVEGVDVAENYVITEVAGNFEITPVDHKIELVIKPHDAEATYNGQTQYAPKASTITFGTGLDPALHGMDVDYAIHGEGIAIGKYAITVVDDTTVVTQDGKDVTDNFLLRPGAGKLTIKSSGTKMPLHIVPDNKTETFTGHAIPVTVTTGTITLNNASYSQTDVNRTLDIVFTANGIGLAPYTYDIDLDKASVGVYAVTDTLRKNNLVGEYDITTAPGTLTITYDDTNKGTIHITPDPASLLYSGEVLTATVTTGAITVNETPLNVNELDISFTAKGSGQTVGEYNNITVEMNSVKIIDKISKQDISKLGYYTITAQPSTLTIKPRTGGEDDPKLVLRIKPEDQYVDYDGNEHTVTVTEGDVWVDGASVPQFSQTGINVSFEATGTGTSTVGSPYPITLTQGSVEVMIDNEDMTGNYTVVQDEAYLHITGSGSLIPVTITPAAQGLYYNGKMQTVEVTAGAIKINGQPVPTGTTVAFKATGEGDVPVTGGYPIVIDKTTFLVTVGGNDETANYQLFPTNGTLTIKPLPDEFRIPIELTIPGDSSAFNGSVQTRQRTQQDATAIEVGTGVNKKLIATLNTENGNTLAVVFKANAEGQTPDNYPFVLDADETKVTLNGKDVTNQYAVTLNPAIFKITPLTDGDRIPLSITPIDLDAPYNGELQYGTSNDLGTVLIGIDELPPKQAGVEVTFDAQGQGTDPDKYPIKVLENTVKVMMYDQIQKKKVDVTGSYRKILNDSWFTITPLTGEDRIPVYIKPNYKAVKYTGYEQTVHQDQGTIEVGGERATPVAAGVSVTFDAQGTGTDPDTYEMVISENIFKVISVLGGNDITSSYVLVPKKGVLEITKRPADDLIPLEITPNVISREHTGLPQQVTVSDGTFVHDGNTGLPAGMTVTFTANGVGTDIGDHDTFVQSGATVQRGTVPLTENYEIIPKKGVFKITPSSSKPILYIKPDNAEDWYDGNELTTIVTTGTVLIGGPNGQPLPNGTTVTFTAKGTGQAVGTYDISVGTWTITDSSGDDAKGQYQTQFETGTYTIKQRDGIIAQLIPLQITPIDVEESYTGEIITAWVTAAVTNGILINYAPPPWGVNVNFTATGMGLAQGTYSIEVNDGWRVMVDGKDMCDNYRLVSPSQSTLTITPLTGANRIKLSITPENREDTYTGYQLSTGPVTVGTIRMNNAAKPALLDVAFTAEGHGLNVGLHDIDVNETVGAWSVKYGSEDVTTNYVLDPHPGIFTIKKASIPITVSMDDPASVVYNGQNQTTVPTAYVVRHNLVPDPGVIVTIDKAVTGKDAKDYPIAFTKDNVKIMIGTENVTQNYVITPVSDAIFTITPKPLTGSVTVNNPGGPYVYGDKAQDWTPDATEAIIGLEPGDTIYYTITRDVDSKDVGSYMFDITPEDLKNPNYDTTGVAWNRNGPMQITPATLTVTAGEVWVAQNGSVPSVYPYRVNGYQYGETQQAVGPHTIAFGMTGATTADPIGTTGIIGKVNGETALTNYNVTYVGNTFGVYGEVLYHSNYPSGVDVVVPYGEYRAQSDMPIAPNPATLGFGLEDLMFEEWTKDAAGADPYPATGEPIGPQSIDLYAKWIPMYKLTIRHLDIIEDSEIAPSESRWLMEDMKYTIEAKEIDGYEPVYVKYFVDEVEAFTGTITLEEGVELTMPDKSVEAFIYYRALEVPPIPEFELPANGSGYLLSGDDIPLAGVISLNRGICFE